MTYRELADQLIPYVKNKGFTHLHLLPISEHPFAGAWGYQPIGLFAPTSRQGTADDFARFVNCCHEHDLALFLDWVPTHFPADVDGLARFDGTHLYEHADRRKGLHSDWDILIYSYGWHEVTNFLLSNALYWLLHCHVDDLRVDAMASMLYLDYSRPEGHWLPNPHGGVQRLICNLNHIYRTEPAQHKWDCLAEGFSWLDLHNAEQSVFAFMSRGRSDDRIQVVICNFAPEPRSDYRQGVPLPGGYELRINTDAAIYGGSDFCPDTMALAGPIASRGQPLSLILNVPPLATLILARHRP